MEILSQSYPESDSLPIIKSLFLRLRKNRANTMAWRISSESKGEMSDGPHAEILVVDDDAMSRRLLAQLLMAAGFKCLVCKDGSEALEIIHAKPPSLLLLDFDMPGLNGAEVLTRLRSDHNPAVAQIPVIMLTAHGSEESEVSCLQAGADDFVTKPVYTAVLQARIETQLRLRSMRRQLERQNDELENWRRDLERDLEAARLTQQSLIPQKPPALFGWEVATCYRPVIQVGGDIYGWLRMKDGRILFWIVDGTGHGAAAALLTTLANPPLLIARRTGATETIASVAPPLGLVESPELTETIVNLKPGDTFLLYTDGLFGSRKGKESRLNSQFLEKMLDHSAPSAEALLGRILEETAPSKAEEALPDDVAALAVRRTA